jgi:hypothetical protein
VESIPPVMAEEGCEEWGERRWICPGWGQWRRWAAMKDLGDWSATEVRAACPAASLVIAGGGGNAPELGFWGCLRGHIDRRT